MDDQHGYGPWRAAAHRQHCEGDGCEQTIEVGERVQTAPDGRQLGECCGIWKASDYFGSPPAQDTVG